MRNLLIAIVCAMIVTRSMADELPKTTRNLESTKATTSVFDYQGWYEKASGLEGRVGQRDRYPGRYRRRTGQPEASPYNELSQAGAVYDGLTLRQASSPDQESTTKRREGESHREEEKAVGAKPTQIKVFDSKQHTAITEAAYSGTPPPKKHNCKCEGECTCPPYVCDAGNCKANYVVIFGRNDCQYCRKLWKIIPHMRKKGYIVFYVDTEAFPHVVKQFKMKVVPTILVYDKKRVTARFNGVTTQEKITKFLKTRIEQGIDTPKKDNE